ncbi:MAG: TonB-dependent receptor [Saprospiraceae bacterium]|nr:TonB-dependent receptor [Saprospiraceae bacterium]
MKKFVIMTGALFALLGSIPDLKGQPLLPDTLDNPVRLKDVVVTAQYSPQSERNADYKVEVINREIIELKGANNLRELLQHELGINISQKSVFGSSLEFQGMSKENIKILIDGVPVIGRLNGTIDLGQISLANIDRIEMIQGPVSVFYGTDAMGGVVNLITKKYYEGNGEIRASAGYESIGALDFNLGGGFNFGKNTISMHGAYYDFGGLTTANAPRSKNWEPKTQYMGHLGFARKLNNLTLRYAAQVSDEKLYSIGDTVKSNSGVKSITDADYFTRRIDNSLNLQGPVLPKHFFDATVAYQDYRRFHDTYKIDPQTGESSLSNTDLRENNQELFGLLNARAQFGRNDGAKRFNYAMGIDYYYESTEGERILNHKQSNQTGALLGSLNFRLWERVEIQPALRFSYNNVFGNVASPAFNFKMPIAKTQVIRFAYARGYRAPSLKELYLDFAVKAGPVTYLISGNPNLNPEQSHSFNLFYTLELFKNRLRVEPSLFYNEVESLIALSDLVDNNRNYINIDQFRSKGGILNLSFKGSSSFKAKAGFAWIGRYNRLSETTEASPFLFTPELNAKFQYTLPVVRIQLNLFYKMVGEMPGFTLGSAGELLETQRDAFSVWDIDLARSFDRPGITLFAGVKNLLDVDNIETLNQAGAAHSSDMQLWGRSFFVKIQYRFSWDSSKNDH